ncbi:MAG: hypothetical protein JNM47_05445 [Hyphomonadaceae bacterium]|nr:hypothetical protein [Hyphomonadaceae bacterium]
MTKNRLIHDDETDNAPEPVRTRAEPPRERDPEVATRAPARAKKPYADQRKVTAYVDAQTFMWLKSIHAQTNKTMMAIMEEALTQYVQAYAAKQKFGGGQGS